MLDFPKWKSILTVFIIIVTMSIVGVDFYNKSRGEKEVGGIKLGLDLKGGSYLVLEADRNSFLQDYSSILFENIRSSLQSNKIAYYSIKKNEGSVSFNLNDISNLSKLKQNLMSFDNNLKWENKGNYITVTLSESSYNNKLKDLIQSSIEVIRNRIDQTGTNEPSIKQRGSSQIVIELPGVDNPEQVKRLIGTTAKLTFHIVDSEATLNGQALKPNYKYVGSSDYSIPRYAIKIEPELYGRNLVNAKMEFQDNAPVVFFMFDTDGARKFASITKEQVGNMLAIVLDNKVISAPRINSPITGGSGIISGNFTIDQAQELAILLKAGSLPVPFVVVEERVVGPTLGKESIHSGIVAGVIGYVIVFAFMIIFYRNLGIIANVSLIFNAIFILAGLSLMGATLTLPGIAGIILTIGMAVDANILVYERLAADIRSSRKMSYALLMSSAFKRVFTTITDSNLTTLIVALFLFSFGTGPIKGFAVTLIIGIISSIFGIMFVTKLLINIFILNNKKNQKIKTKRA